MEVNKENSYIGQNNFFDYSVIALCLIILAISGYFFQNKLSSSTNSAGPTLGKIISYTNDIRLKKKEDLVWNPLQINDKLREKDSVFSGDSSEVVLDLSGVGVVQLSSNTMIQILKENNESIVDLSSGTFQIKKRTGKTISIRDHGKKIKLQVTPGDYKFTKTEAGVNISVFSGEAKIEGQSEVVSTNSELNIADNKVEVKNFNIGFLKPINNSTLYDNNDKISFEIDSSCPDNCFLVFSNKENFADSIKVPFPKDSNSFLANVALKGTIHFKLTDSLDSNISLPFVVHRKPIVTPQAIFPPESFKTKEKVIHFEWSSSISPEIKSHFQISQDKNFSNVLYDKVTTENIAEYELAEGEYFWRTRFEFENVQSPWTKVHFLNLDFELIHPVTLFIPKTNLLLVKGEAKLHLKLSRNFEASYYEITLLKDDTVLKKFKDTKDFYEISLTKAGDYKIKVETFSEKNKKNGQSETFDFKVTPFQPLPAPDLQNPEQDIEILDSAETTFFHRLLDLIIPSAHAEEMKAQLSWKPIDGAVSYRLEIANEESFKNVLVKEILNEPQFSWLPKKVGKYFWRVTPIDINNLDGQTSRIGFLNVFPHFSKLAPPKIEAKILGRGSESFSLKAKWEEVSRVSKYEIFLTYFSENNSEIGDHKFTLSDHRFQNSFSIPKEVSSLKLTVKAISKKGSQTPFSVLKLVLPPLPVVALPPPKEPEVAENIVPMNLKNRLIQISYEQFSMGSHWDSISERVNNKISNTSMKLLSSRYFIRKDWVRIGAGLDYFILNDGDLSINAGAVGFEIAHDFSLRQRNNLFFSPALSAFYAPSLDQGLYGLKFNAPLAYSFSESFRLYAGAGYAYAKFFGIPPLQQVLDINVAFGGLNLVGGCLILF